MSLIALLKRVVEHLREEKTERTFFHCPIGNFFHCPIGNADAEVFPQPPYELKERRYRNETGIPNERQVSIACILHNYPFEFLIECPEMNLSDQDDGGCFCVTTDVPGTCLAQPLCRSHYEPHSHKGCLYLGKSIEEVRKELRRKS